MLNPNVSLLQQLKTTKKFILITPNVDLSILRKVIKKILSRLLISLRKTLNLQQWINSASTSSLDVKESLTFLQFDTIEFYPNISEKLVKDALEFAKAHH